MEKYFENFVANLNPSNTGPVYIRDPKLATSAANNPSPNE